MSAGEDRNEWVDRLLADPDGERARRARAYLGGPVPCITDARAEASEGGSRDFYSQGDYWWPNPDSASGLPFVRRDGESYPGAFHEHRTAMRSVRRAIALLAEHYLRTRESCFAEEACRYAHGFFLDSKTGMMPRLEYAQAIPGITPGRGTGIIDTLHIGEVPVAFMALESSVAGDERASGQVRETAAALREWFSEYLSWMRSSPNGVEERDKANNHAVAWTVQTAIFSRFTSDVVALNEARERTVGTHITDQMAPDGSFPLELERTKPYSYSLFNLDLIATLCHVLSERPSSLWHYATDDGRGPARGVDFMVPYVQDKASWPFGIDVDHWDELPIRQPFLLFGAYGLRRPDLLAVWNELPSETRDKEVMRNLLYRSPALWFGPVCA